MFLRLQDCSFGLAASSAPGLLVAAPCVMSLERRQLFVVLAAPFAAVFTCSSDAVAEGVHSALFLELVHQILRAEHVPPVFPRVRRRAVAGASPTDKVEPVLWGASGVLDALDLIVQSLVTAPSGFVDRQAMLGAASPAIFFALEGQHSLVPKSTLDLPTF